MIVPGTFPGHFLLLSSRLTTYYYDYYYYNDCYNWVIFNDERAGVGKKQKKTLLFLVHAVLSGLIVDASVGKGEAACSNAADTTVRRRAECSVGC